MAPPEKRKRISVKMKSPNPLFEKWLTEWKDKAKENDSKMQYCFNAALKSLKKYPIPLESGKDCKILKGFGDKLCVMLDKKLQAHKKGDIPEIEVSPKKTNQSKNKTGSEYIPQFGSGAYAILVALYEKSLQDVHTATKQEIIETAKHLSNTSFTKPEPNTRYTAWSSMKTLLDKNLVSKSGRPAKFSLTETGTELARKLKDSSKITELINCDMKDVAKLNNDEVVQIGSGSSGVVKASSSLQTQSCESVENFVIFAPNSFDIILYVDNQETSGTKTKPSDDPLLFYLDKFNVPYEVKHLTVGDFVWICRDKTTKVELVLPHIVERKRMDDLAHSIKDGRYHEQKFRLKRSNIKNVIYLIENYKDKQLGLPVPSLYQAATNTAIQDGFFVKFTGDLIGTARYLATFTTMIDNRYKSLNMISCRAEDLPSTNPQDDLLYLVFFKEFNKNSTKNKPVSVRDLFVRTLIQIKGMSVEKALAIVDKYSSPVDLLRTYKGMSADGGEKLLACIQFNAQGKKVGPVLSKTIYQFFTREKF